MIEDCKIKNNALALDIGARKEAVGGFLATGRFKKWQNAGFELSRRGVFVYRESCCPVRLLTARNGRMRSEQGLHILSHRGGGAALGLCL